MNSFKKYTFMYTIKSVKKVFHVMETFFLFKLINVLFNELTKTSVTS